MNKYKTISKISKPETFECKDQHKQTDYCGENFQYPGKVIMRTNSRADKANKKQEDKEVVLFHVLICLLNLITGKITLTLIDKPQSNYG